MAISAPLRSYKFQVSWDGLTRAGFQKCGSPEVKHEVIEYREGNMTDQPIKVKGQATYSDITLERGTSVDNDFGDWCNQVFNPTSPRPDFGDGQTVDADGLLVEGYTKNVTIKVYDTTGKAVREYTLLDAWPVNYKPGDLDATDKTGLQISSLTITYHGFTERNLD